MNNSESSDEKKGRGVGQMTKHAYARFHNELEGNSTKDELCTAVHGITFTSGATSLKETLLEGIGDIMKNVINWRNGLENGKEIIPLRNDDNSPYAWKELDPENEDDNKLSLKERAYLRKQRDGFILSVDRGEKKAVKAGFPELSDSQIKIEFNKLID